MTNDVEKDMGAELSRRGILGRAALIAGGAATGLAVETAMARPSDVSVDTMGRPTVDGNLMEGSNGSEHGDDAQIARPRVTNNCRCTNNCRPA